MANAKIDLKTPRPLYAGVGVTDRAVEALRGSFAHGQKRIDELQADARSLDLDTVTREAKARRTAVENRIVELRKDVQSVPTRIQARIQATLADRELTYGQLVDRGETLVERIRNQRSTQDAKRSAKTTKSKAKTTRTQSEKAADTTASQAKGAATSTKNTAKSAAKKTADSAKSGAKSTRTTAKSQSTRPKSSAKATGTAAKKTATAAAKATKDAAAKVGD